MISLDTITLAEALRKVHEHYGIYNQFEVHGDSIDTLMLVPRTDRGYDEMDMANLSIDAEFLTECIIAETEL
jgi:hypothetical protein